MKRILSIVLALAMVLSVFGVTATAEDTKAKVYLKETKAYEVQKDETKIYVPIMVEGTIDMQCYDITVTYDKTMLDVVADETAITILPEGEYTYGVVNTGTEGEIRFSGMTTDEAAKTATGQVGTICFTSAKRVSKDGIEVALGLEVIELGFGTEVADIEVVADGKVILNKSADTSTPEPTVTLGDVDEDGIISATDALAVLKHAAKLEILEGNKAIAADVNRDETIDANDALLILKKAAVLITEF